MARLNYPDRAMLAAQAAAKPPTGNGEQQWSLDQYSAAHVASTETGAVLTVSLWDSGGDPAHRLTLTHRTHPLPHWTVEASGPGNGGDPVTLPEPLLARANRLLSPDGVSLQRDWRTKAHVLKAAPRRVLPLLSGVPVTAAHTANGWQAMAVASITEAAGRALAPVAPTPGESGSTDAPTDPAPGAADQGTDAPTPSTGSASAMPTQGIPAAYAGKVVISKQARAKWLAARAMHRAGQPAVIAMVGPSGAGKTHAVHALSAEEGLDVVKFDASGVVEPGDWFGTVTLDGSGTRFVPSDLLLAITLPGKRTLLLDEVNRANLRALNAMLPIMDGSGTVTIPQSGKRERVNRDVQVVVTANIGSQFLGTEPLDEAIRTRVAAWIEIDHLAEDEEKALLLERVEGLTDYDATNLARLGAAVRAASENGQHPPVSTRQLLSAAWMIVGGADARLAVDAAVLDGYLADGGASSERAKVRPHVAGIQWRQPKPGAVYSGEAVCQCSHTPADHGIGTDVSISTHCRTCARLYPNQAHRQCMAFSAAMNAADDEEGDL